jgi:hypothetical protein
MALGSCFAENIGLQLAAFRFDIDINPFGILYNPASIAASLNRLLDGNAFTGNDLTERNGLWHSFSHHGQFSAASTNETLKLINDRFYAAADRITTCNHLLITFGTSWIYQLRDNQQIVANCHKFPESHFTRRRLSVEEISEEWIALTERLRKINPEVNIIFTVSPIRHWRDGAHENLLSKSTLLLAIDRIGQSAGTAYFPAYELMMDELRDYRFYAADMLHPSTQAVTYIRERFSGVWFDEATKQALAEVEQINKALLHRPLHPDSEEYIHFCNHTAQRIETLKQRYPHIRF